MATQMDVNDLKTLVCSNCKGQVFTQAFNLKEIPAILNQSGKPGIMFLTLGFMCVSCGSLVSLESAHEPDSQIIT